MFLPSPPLFSPSHHINASCVPSAVFPISVFFVISFSGLSPCMFVAPWLWTQMCSSLICSKLGSLTWEFLTSSRSYFWLCWKPGQCYLFLVQGPWLNMWVSHSVFSPYIWVMSWSHDINSFPQSNPCLWGVLTVRHSGVSILSPLIHDFSYFLKSQ